MIAHDVALPQISQILEGCHFTYTVLSIFSVSIERTLLTCVLGHIEDLTVGDMARKVIEQTLAGCSTAYCARTY